MSYDKAQNALGQALDSYKLYLPYETIKTAKRRGAADIFEILPAGQFQAFFNLYWHSFFKLHSSSVIRTCPAFVTPEQDPGKRKIYIKDDGNTLSNTLFHEVIHYFRHPNFYPKFYEVAGQNPYVLEGVTEYFTRDMDTVLAFKRNRDMKYENNFLATDS